MASVLYIKNILTTKETVRNERTSEMCWMVKILCFMPDALQSTRLKAASVMFTKWLTYSFLKSLSRSLNSFGQRRLTVITFVSLSLFA